MKSLLVVEDEKLIRQGIVVMAKRAPVKIEEVLECRNGEEALEILKSRDIDVMFTDIRMPKMDGITLISRLSELKNPPKTVVISGYDDFGYAVEALRGGVKDYILKPIERNKVYGLLEKLDQELAGEREAKVVRQRLSRQQLRYVISNGQIPDQEMEELEKQYEEQREYVICQCSVDHRLEAEDLDFEQLMEIQAQSVFLCGEEELQRLLSQKLSGYCVGVSAKHRGIRELQRAYEESSKARIAAFVTGKAVVTFSKEEGDEELEEIPGNFAGQFVQIFGTDKVQSILNRLENYYFRAKRGKVDPEALLEVTKDILEQLLVTYKNVLDMNMTGYVKLQQPLSYNDADAFLLGFRNWMMETKELMASEFSDYRNKEKINMAVAYIRENYDKDLNMAMVSNHISMNYSLFSLSFKQYTGMNFVNYLKMIRIKEAKRLLEETDEKVIDISQMVGYENEKHFMKTFKSVCGVSPSEYRKNMQLGKKVD